MAARVTSEEEAQQLQATIEMFEAITESQPDDYQSLEILKEAYSKLGRDKDALHVARKLATAYTNLGHISQAILEYEGILEDHPNDPDATSALQRLTDQTSQLSPTAPPATEDSKPLPATGKLPGAPAFPDARGKTEDGDQALIRVLISEKILTPQVVDPLLQRLKTAQAAQPDKAQKPTLLQFLATEQLAKLDDLLTILINRSGHPFMPLSTYDADRDTVCLLPQEICWQCCLIPFDLISRSVLIATGNPFDQHAKERVQSMLDYNIFWYVAPPADILSALRRVHGVDGARPNAVKS
jgi:tetratricopeptide (TPR) repeat protein